jgi:hypothetical protein
LLVKKATAILLKLCALSHLVGCAALASFEQTEYMRLGGKLAKKPPKYKGELVIMTALVLAHYPD